MKRILVVIALCVMTFWSAHNSAARGFGITGGASFVGLKDVNQGSATGYHAGLTYQFKLPLGFAIQPSVLYHMKGSVVRDAYENGASLDLKTGFVEVPVSFQWGPDLILFRPFLDVTPFVGYGLSSGISWEVLNRLEYGLGVGLGVDLWRLQVIGRYNWNFGPLLNSQGELPSGEHVMTNVESSLFGGNNYDGVTLTVAFIF